MNSQVVDIDTSFATTGKRLTLWPTDKETGAQNFHAYWPEAPGELSKTANVKDYMPELREFIGKIKPDNIHVYVIINALGASENWGCFTSDAPILMADGRQKRISEIQIGDLVRTHTGKVRPVEKLWRKEHHLGLTSIKFSGLIMDLNSTPNHPVRTAIRDDVFRLRRDLVYKRPVRDRESYETQSKLVLTRVYEDAGYLAAEELQPGDLTFHPFNTLVKETEELRGIPTARLLGYYAAEGCRTLGRPLQRGKGLRRNGADLRRADPNKDPEVTGVVYVLGKNELSLHADIIKQVAALGAKTSPVPDANGSAAVRLQVSLKQFTSITQRHIPGFSETKSLSTEIKQMPTEWQKEFLQAYLNGDGCQRTPKERGAGTLRFSTASYQLALDIQELCWRLGIPAAVRKGKQGKGSIAEGNTIYEGDLGQSGARVLDGENTRFVVPQDQETLGSQPRIVLDMSRGVALVPVTGVATRDWSGEVFNLEVADDNTYVAFGTVVHNSNSNGDDFPEESLRHDGDDYGFRTFLKAKVFRHHSNHDPDNSIGDVLFSGFNPVMKRVELVARISKEKSPKTVEKIANGEFFPTSMGCKIDKDRCSVPTCGHESKKISEYCDHLRDHMGEIDKDTGVKIAAINPRPRFFDISEVLIGADKTSWVMAKVAGDEKSFWNLPSGKIAEVLRIAESKDAEIRKKVVGIAELAPIEAVKRKADKKVQKTAMEILSREEKIPKSVLAKFAEDDPYRAISTLAYLGIPLRPVEFQHIFMSHSGLLKTANSLYDSNISFRLARGGQGQRIFPMDESLVDMEIAKKASSVISKRSIFHPFLAARALEKRASNREISGTLPTEPGSFQKIAAAYSTYLERLARLYSSEEERQGIQQSPVVQSALAEALDEDLFTTKHASVFGTSSISRALQSAIANPYAEVVKIAGDVTHCIGNLPVSQMSKRALAILDPDETIHWIIDRLG